jgi:hypothetical protein
MMGFLWSASQLDDKPGELATNGAWLKDHIRPAPRIFVDGLPAVPRSCCGLGQEDCRRVQHKMPAGARLEVERAN